MPRKKKTVLDEEKTKERIEQEAAQRAYDRDRAGHRNAASRHVLKLETDMTEDEKRRTFALANDLRIASNRLTEIMEKRVKALIYQDRYKELKRQYRDLSQKSRKKKTRKNRQNWQQRRWKLQMK